jgi:glycosyltransferase involved in cell wall biosynthesis
MTEQTRRTILVLAYSISPVRGSEYAVGWNYVTHMSRDHDLVVLYGLAGDHMGDFDEMAEVTPDRFGGHVTFVPIAPDRWAQIANHLNRTGRVPFSFYIAYRYWHLSALAAAKRIIAERRIDVVHYLCPIGFREPGYLWKLDKPYIWGPIGGMNMRPVRAFFDLSPVAGLRTAARNIANWLQFRFSPRLSRALRATDLLLANTSENQGLIARVHARKAELLPENAIVAQQPSRIPPPPGAPLRLVWVGRLDQAKAPEILIEALATISSLEWRLTIVGDGPRAGAIRDLAAERGIAERVTWTGRIGREEVARRFADADVHVLTSLAEAHSTVLFEAMSAGVPTIAIDHCGMRDSICDACGIKIALGSVASMSDGFAAAIRGLIENRAIVERLSAGAGRCAERNGWGERTRYWRDAYMRAIAAHQARRAA